MRLTVLGGAAASPNTGMGCSGYLVESAATRLLIDPGPGTLQELRKHTDFRALSAVSVSHMHLDHVLDLLALRHALAYNPITSRAPIPVWLPPGGASLLARACAPFDECDDPGTFDATVSVSEYDPDSIFTIGDLSIAFAPTVHYLPTWAMRIESAAGKSLGYTADCGPASDFTMFFDRVDLLLAEATLGVSTDRTDSARGSLSAEEAARLACDCRARRLVITHYWEEFEPPSIRAAAARLYRGQVELARPGLVIELT